MTERPPAPPEIDPDYVAGLIDGGAKITLEVNEADASETGYHARPVVEIRRRGAVALFGLLDEFCSTHEITCEVYRNDEEYVWYVHGTGATERLLELLDGQIRRLAQDAALMRDEIIPRLRADEYHTREGFLSIVALADTLTHRQTYAHYLHYDTAYFEEQWEMDAPDIDEPDGRDKPESDDPLTIKESEQDGSPAADDNESSTTDEHESSTTDEHESSTTDEHESSVSDDDSQEGTYQIDALVVRAADEAIDDPETDYEDRATVIDVAVRDILKRVIDGDSLPKAPPTGDRTTPVSVDLDPMLTPLVTTAVESSPEYDSVSTLIEAALCAELQLLGRADGDEPNGDELSVTLSPLFVRAMAEIVEESDEWNSIEEFAANALKCATYDQL